ncbi:hypothetical protein ACMHYO_14150 [Allopusillimonas ginsengisoli]|uniref:hypothetical protein n=1 Tax=Allopusillimonas ginsengisoli TaxID=453575 RepID=UPI0039C2C7AA
MTKPTIPEPTAEIRIVGNVTIFDLTPVGKQQCLSVGQKFITTDQAQAYAEARVREALEGAAQLCDNRALSNEQAISDDEPDEAPCLRSAAWQLSVTGQRIRALIK